MSAEVVALRLATGEDIVATVVSRSGSGDLVLQKPMQLILTPSKEEQSVEIGLVTFFPFAAKGASFHFGADRILLETEPSYDVKSLYLRATSSLHLPNSREMVGHQVLKG